MRRLLIPAVLILMGGCDAGSGPLGEPILQVVSGDGQTAPAAAQDTIEPVRARLGRQPAEGIASRIRLVRNLYAQTIVQGIAGEQVCSEGIGEVPLVAWNKCDITDPNGGAEFFFEPGTIATDSSCAEIRAVVDGSKVVTDVVCVRVEPGPIVVPSDWKSWAGNNPRDTAEVALFSPMFRDAHGNISYAWRVTGTDWLEAVGDTAGTHAAHQIRKTRSDVALGDTATVRFYDAADSLLIDGVGTLMEFEYSHASAPDTRITTWGVDVVRRENYQP